MHKQRELGLAVCTDKSSSAMQYQMPWHSYKYDEPGVSTLIANCWQIVLLSSPAKRSDMVGGVVLVSVFEAAERTQLAVPGVGGYIPYYRSPNQHLCFRYILSHPRFVGRQRI